MPIKYPSVYPGFTAIDDIKKGKKRRVLDRTKNFPNLALIDPPRSTAK